MKHLKSHVRHDDPEIMSISHIHVLLLSSAISLIVSLTLPSWSPVLVLKLPTGVEEAPLTPERNHETEFVEFQLKGENSLGKIA